MVLFRNAYSSLMEWKDSHNRKPLVIRGARQVGKTTLVRQFAKEFNHFIELNLEREVDRKLFELDNVNKILNAAYLLKGKRVSEGTVLLFIDEIQESPLAIQKLRYFFEDQPQIYVIAAGSLLEFALKDVTSFPVGRVSYLYLYPLNFEEYLRSKRNQPALDAFYEIPIPEHAHSTLLNLFHEYAIIGGMPEINAEFITHNNFSTLDLIYNQLWQSYKDDIEKYSKNDTERKIIRHLIDTSPYEGDRISFERFGNSNYRSREVGEAFRTLEKSGIIRLAYPTTCSKPPIVSDLRKRPRLQFLDTGILNHALQIQGEQISVNDLNDFYRGRIIHHLANQELISTFDRTNFKSHFWVREERNSSAEVDIVFHHSKYLIPIEIKSGKQGKLRSLHQFIVKAQHPFAIRLWAGNFSVENVKTPNGSPFLLMNLPYYLVTRISNYIDYFVTNYHVSE